MPEKIEDNLLFTNGESLEFVDRPGMERSHENNPTAEQPKFTKDELLQILKPTSSDITTVEAIEQAQQMIGEKQLIEYFQANKPDHFGKQTSDQIKFEGWAFECFARNIIKLQEIGYTGDDLLQTALNNIPDGLKPDITRNQWE